MWGPRQAALQCCSFAHTVGCVSFLHGCTCIVFPLFASAQRSGDVGIGLNARRLREKFTNRFNITYSLRPVGELGTVFRRYPELWKVFVEEPGLPGR